MTSTANQDRSLPKFPDVPEAGPVVMGLVSVCLLAGLVGYFLVGWQDRLAGNPALFYSIAVLGILAAVPLGAGTARLMPVIRHTYNVHYVALVAACLFGWTLVCGPSLAQRPTLAVALQGLMVAAGTIAAACAVASISARRAGQWELASLGALGCLAMALGTQSPLALVLLPVGIFLPWMWKDLAEGPEMTQGRQGLVGFISFVMISIVALIGITQPLGLLILSIFRTAYDGEPSVSGETTADDFLAGLVLRWLICLLTVPITVACIFAWPHRRFTRIAASLAAGCLVVACLLTGRRVPEVPLLILVAAVPGVISLIGASSIASVLPRGSRLPLALTGAAVAATCSLEWTGVPPPDFGLLLGLTFLAEASVLALLWIIAYLLGIRVLRARQEKGS